MPVEIRELVIKTTVTGSVEKNQDKPKTGSSKEKTSTTPSAKNQSELTGKSLAKLRESILNDCFLLISEQMTNNKER